MASERLFETRSNNRSQFQVHTVFLCHGFGLRKTTGRAAGEVALLKRASRGPERTPIAQTDRKRACYSERISPLLFHRGINWKALQVSLKILVKGKAQECWILAQPSPQKLLALLSCLRKASPAGLFLGINNMVGFCQLSRAYSMEDQRCATDITFWDRIFGLVPERPKGGQG